MLQENALAGNKPRSHRPHLRAVHGDHQVTKWTSLSSGANNLFKLQSDAKQPSDHGDLPASAMHPHRLNLQSPLAPTCAIFDNQIHSVGDQGLGSRTLTPWYLLAFLCAESFQQGLWKRSKASKNTLFNRFIWPVSSLLGCSSAGNSKQL